MNRSFSLNVFMIAFAVVYLAGFMNGWTEWRYYPLTGAISTVDLPRSEGPAMGWYSWIVQGLLAGVVAYVVSLLVPKRMGDKVWSGVLWVVPSILVIYTLYFEWHWFQ
jgi:hypothetical protein